MRIHLLLFLYFDSFIENGDNVKIFYYYFILFLSKCLIQYIGRWLSNHLYILMWNKTFNSYNPNTVLSKQFLTLLPKGVFRYDFYFAHIIRWLGTWRALNMIRSIREKTLNCPSHWTRSKEHAISTFISLRAEDDDEKIEWWTEEMYDWRRVRSMHRKVPMLSKHIA